MSQNLVIILRYFIFLTLLLSASSCKSSGTEYFPNITRPVKFENWRKGAIQLPNKRLLVTEVLITEKEKGLGLSGIQEKDFPLDRAILFHFPKMGFRKFWMPDTYFPLDIIYLDSKLKIIEIHKNVPFHPSRKIIPAIPVLPKVWAQYVVELKSKSPIIKGLKKGMVLKWKAKFSLEQIEPYTHQKK
jgi:uncharacterized membrane protein (UPF0127 family)